jgi:NAD(P)-dependent dehydrogenase (short-subunit alcohol dehydrogenase family)
MSGFKLDGCRAVVTGGGSGLGRALALELSRRSARVVIADVDVVGGEETARLIQESGRRDEGAAVVHRCDVTSAEQVEDLARFAEERLGGIDFVANNAGVAVAGDVGVVSLDDWRFVVGVNLWGVIHGCHVFVPRLRKQKRGAILNVASAAGLLAPPTMAPYNVTKAGVVSLSETLHAELRRDGIGVTVLCPTFFRTQILASSRGPTDDKQRAAVEKMMDGSRVQAPEVARAALSAVERGSLYAVPMWDGSVMWLLKRLFPSVFHGFLGSDLVARLTGRPS